MIELLQFPRGPGLMNLSPFCMKAQVFLRLAGLPHRCINDATPLRTPKGKLPVLRDDGKQVADSAAIVAYLQQHRAAALPQGGRAGATESGGVLRAHEGAGGGTVTRGSHPLEQMRVHPAHRQLVLVPAQRQRQLA